MSREVFFTADQHFDHISRRGGIIAFAQRPFSCIEEMNQALTDNWNSLVRPCDTVYILGDFAWANHGRHLQALKGKKVLLRGSHDKMPQEVLRQFREVHEAGAMISVGNHEGAWCAHTCHRVWERGHYFVPHLFAHSHARLETWNMSCDVGVDSARMYKKFFPNPWPEIRRWMADRADEMRANGRVTVDDGKELCHQDDAFWLRSQLESANRRLLGLPQIEAAARANRPHWQLTPTNREYTPENEND
jgi:calcineurin-like phosphoesterase family protein